MNNFESVINLCIPSRVIAKIQFVNVYTSHQNFCDSRTVFSRQRRHSYLHVSYFVTNM